MGQRCLHWPRKKVILQHSTPVKSKPVWGLFLYLTRVLVRSYILNDMIATKYKNRYNIYKRADELYAQFTQSYTK